MKNLILLLTLTCLTWNGMAQIESGRIHLLYQKDTLNFSQAGALCQRNIIPDPDSVYDDNIIQYVTRFKPYPITITYETYASANILTIQYNQFNYSIGTFDGAADVMISGLNEIRLTKNDTPYLIIEVTAPLTLSTGTYLFNQGNLSHADANLHNQYITLLPGTCVIWEIHD